MADTRMGDPSPPRYICKTVSIERYGKTLEGKKAKLVALAVEAVKRARNCVDDVQFYAEDDVTGRFCTKWNERESIWRKSGHADEEVQARANRDDAAAD